MFCTFLHTFPWRCALILQGVAGALMLAAAFAAQYGFALHPCELCLLQRYPYAVIMALSFIGALARPSEKIVKLLIMAGGLLFFADAMIAAYHAGVELQLFPGPTACTSTASHGDSLEDMRRAIMNAPLVSCDQPMLQVLGISMAGWNALAALALAGLSGVFLACKAKTA